ncbi:hypothetical protein FRC01_010075 [Tulasnella sp. 417]|nr:hypothetical protein FRC01_010075 [Tulasnella sp. 417]
MIKIPSGPSRKYVTDVAFAKKKEAREAVARLALDMGAVDFLQTGDDKKHLDRARANKDGEASDGVVSTLGGKVHHYDVDVVPPSPAIARIEECCQTWRTGKVSPHWLIFAHLQDPRRFGAMLQIRLTPELNNPSIVRVWSTSAEYTAPDKAKNDVAELAMKQGVLDFIKFGNGQKNPNEGAQVAIAPLLAVGETFGNPTHVDPLALPRPSITIRQWVDALPRPTPNNIKLEGGTNAIAWVNQVSSQNKVPITYARVYSANGKGVGCILRAGASGIAERSWFVDAMFNSWQEARLAVCFDAVSRGDYDGFMKSTGFTLRGIETVLSGTLTIIVGEDARLTYTVDGPFQGNNRAKEAVVEKAVNGGLIEFLTPFQGPKAEDQQAKSVSEDRNSNIGDQNSGKRKKKGKKNKQNTAQAPFNSTPTGPSSNGTASNASWPLPRRPKPADTNASVVWPRPRDSYGPSDPSSSRGGGPLTGANTTPLPTRAPHAPSMPTLKDTYGPRVPKGPAPPSAPRQPPIHPAGRPDESFQPPPRRQPPIGPSGRPNEPLPPPPMPAPPMPGYGPQPVHAGERYQGYGNEAYGGYHPYADPTMYEAGVFLREPPMMPPPPPPPPPAGRRSPPPRWESYSNYMPPPADLKGKGKARTNDDPYRPYRPMDVEEGEVREQAARYGAHAPPIDDRRWYVERSYPNYPNDVPVEDTRKRSYSAYDDEPYGSPAKRGRWDAGSSNMHSGW